MSGTYLTVRDVAELKSISVQAVHTAAKRGNWPYESVCSQGGCQKRFPLDTLPDDIRLLYNKERLKNAPAVVDHLPDKCTVSAPALTERQRDKALAKADLLRFLPGCHEGRALRRQGAGPRGLHAGL